MGKTCVRSGCDKPVKPKPKRGPQSKYCSGHCRKMVAHENSKTACPECGRRHGSKQYKVCVSCRKYGGQGRVCVFCWTPFVVPRPSYGRLFCDNACAGRKQSPLTYSEQECAWCGVRYLPKKPDRTTCCSRGCGFKYNGKMNMFRAAWKRVGFTPPGPMAHPNWTECEMCGGRFIATNGAKTCSDGCKTEWAAHRARVVAEGKHDPEAKAFDCKECDKHVEPEYGDTRRVFCCKRCGDRYGDREYSRRHRLNNHRHRAKHYGVDYEPVRATKVFERDGWTCGICRQRIDKALGFPHPMSASMDHIIPMAKGGDHKYGNIQAAHLMCNSVKRDTSVGSQLRMGLVP